MIERIAQGLAESDLVLLSCGDAPRSLAELQAINAEAGFAYETSAPLGGVVRHEGVRLTEAELRRVYDHKEAIISQEVSG